LKRLDVHTAGRDLYVRFVAITGDAMGMNMLSKATEHALNKFKEIFEDAQVIIKLIFHKLLQLFMI
jgi:hydroxymethylglutaryl-CoA reductase (NADPH)